MMDRKIKQNCILILAIAALSFLLRFCGLGASSLVSNEAELALNAQQLYRLKGSCASGQLLYLLPTAWIFKFFGSSTAAARLFPALMGFLLTLLPWVLRKKIGDRKAILLAVLLTIDPVLLYWSKRADAVIPTITLVAAGLVFWAAGHQRSGIVFLMLAVCGGERFWPFAFIAAAGIALLLLREKKKTGSRFCLFGKVRKEDLICGLPVLLLFSTGMGTFPAGIGMLGHGLANSLGASPAWTRPGWPAMLIAIVKYCGIPLLLSGIGSFRKRDPRPAVVYTGCFALLLLWQGVMALPYLSICLLAGWVIVILPSRMLIYPANVDFSFCFSLCSVPALFSFLWFRMVELADQSKYSQNAVIHWNQSDYQLPVSSFTASLILTVLCVMILGLIIKILLGFFGTNSVKQGALCGLLIVIGWGFIQNCWTCAGFSRTEAHPAAAHHANSVVLLNGNYSMLRDSALNETLRESLAKRGGEGIWELTCSLDDPLLHWNLIEQGISFNIVQNADRTDWAVTDILLEGDADKSYETKGFIHSSYAYAESIHWNDFTLANWGKWIISEKAAAVPATVNVWVKNSYIFMERSE